MSVFQKYERGVAEQNLADSVLQAVSGSMAYHSGRTRQKGDKT